VMGGGSEARSFDTCVVPLVSSAGMTIGLRWQDARDRSDEGGMRLVSDTDPSRATPFGEVRGCNGFVRNQSLTLLGAR
jgi:hypothetical protein